MSDEEKKEEPKDKPAEEQKPEAKDEAVPDTGAAGAPDAPASPEPPPAAEPPLVIPPDFGHAKKALVVDDDPTSVDLVKRVLEKVKFEVVTAKNGKEGLSQIEGQSFDIIISDVVMPDLDGSEFVRTVKKNESKKDIPILIITVRKNMEDAFLVMGAEGFFSKPLNSKLFLEQVFKSVSRPRKSVLDQSAEKTEGAPAEAPKADEKKEEPKKEPKDKDKK